MTSAETSLTAERLRELLHYDPETGIFTRRVARQGTRVGAVTGWKSPSSGYLQIGVDRVLYRAQRLAWLYMKGEWPVGEVDHKNLIRDDNRFSNLRDVPPTVNQQNRVEARKDSGSGILGVRWDARREKWRARISVESKHRHLGYFDSQDAAQTAYVEAKRRLHPEARAN